MTELENRLAAYQRENKITTKGKLANMLYVSGLAKKKGLPLDASMFVTKGGGQVKGLGKAAVQAILKEYDIHRRLAQECGRTSRGSLGNMPDYVNFLNRLHEEGLADPNAIEAWWVDRIRDFFNSQPFKLKYDTSRSLRSIVSDLLAQAFKRQKETPGTMYAGALLQHLVGAKLSILMPEGAVQCHGFSVADAVSDRSGDFIMDEVIIHVTTAPSEALIRKCKDNLEAGARPIIVTTSENMAGAESLAKIQDTGGRVDIWEAEQFIATNIYEISRFETDKCKITVKLLIDKYNEIVEDCETDPSLKVRVG